MTPEEVQAQIDECAHTPVLQAELSTLGTQLLELAQTERGVETRFKATANPALVIHYRALADRHKKAQVKEFAPGVITQEVFMQLDGKGCTIHQMPDGKIVIQPPGQR